MNDAGSRAADTGALALLQAQKHRDHYHSLHTEIDRAHIVVTEQLRAALRELQTEVEACCREAERRRVADFGQESGPSPPG